MSEDPVSPYLYLSAEPDDHPSKRMNWVTPLLIVWFVVSVFLTGFAIAYSVEGEPHYGDVRVTDAVVIMVAGGMAIVSWTIWSLTLIYRVVQRRCSPFALPLLLVSAFFLFFSYEAIDLYRRDRANWSQMQRQPAWRQKLSESSTESSGIGAEP